MVKKAEDLRQQIGQNSADMEVDTPLYPDMKSKVTGWVQAHGDIIKELLKLKYRIQKTNCNTKITIPLNGHDVTKSLYEWIQRRKEFARVELNAWEKLTDRGLRDMKFQQSNGIEAPIKVRRYYDPEEKENKVTVLKSEPFLIDAALEMANCRIDLVEE